MLKQAHYPLPTCPDTLGGSLPPPVWMPPVATCCVTSSDLPPPPPDDLRTQLSAAASSGLGWLSTHISDIYHSGDQQLHRFTEGRCHLGSRAEVFDAELHAVQETVTTLLTTTLLHSTVFVCIDNRATMDTLNFNKHNHE